MTQALLQIENLKTSFYTQNGEVQALRGMNLSLEAGEALGVVGESGSGKSVMSMSVLQLLAENAKIKEGTVNFNGKVISAMSKNEIRVIRGKEISMIFQDPMSSLNPLISVGEQVAEMIRIHYPKVGKEEMKTRVLELFRLVKIPEPEKRYKSLPHEFSGGMRQRVMIALALACKPDVLIADEPTTALDVTIQAQILDLMKDLQKKIGASVIFITHDLGVVANVADRVAVMYAGRIVEIGTADEVFYDPRHPYTWGLIASMPDLDTQGKLYAIPGTPPNLIAPPKGDAFALRSEYAMKVDLEHQPPFYKVSNTHYAASWLLDERAPQVAPPEIIIRRRERLKEVK